MSDSEYSVIKNDVIKRFDCTFQAFANPVHTPLQEQSYMGLVKIEPVFGVSNKVIPNKLTQL